MQSFTQDASSDLIIADGREMEETKNAITVDLAENEESKDQDKKEANQKVISWASLFKRIRFFARFEHYIKLDILCQTQDENLKWQSYVDKKMKDLCDMLFNDFREQILELRLYPRPFSREETRDTLNMDWTFCESYFIGLKFSRSEHKPIDLRSTVQKFSLMLDINRYNK